MLWIFCIDFSCVFIQLWHLIKLRTVLNKLYNYIWFIWVSYWSCEFDYRCLVYIFKLIFFLYFSRLCIASFFPVISSKKKIAILLIHLPCVSFLVTEFVKQFHLSAKKKRFPITRVYSFLLIEIRSAGLHVCFMSAFRSVPVIHKFIKCNSNTLDFSLLICVKKLAHYHQKHSNKQTNGKKLSYKFYWNTEYK